MLRSVVASLLLVRILGAALPSDPFISDSAVFASFADLIIASKCGLAQTERAAFIVRTPDGRLRLHPWPVTNKHRKSTWKGPIPPDTVAVVHTHPHLDPKPSARDHEEARRLGLPVYALSRLSIYRADPDSTAPVAVVVRHRWWQFRYDEGASSALRSNRTPAVTTASLPR